MNVKQYAEENELTLAEAYEQTGLTHWAQKVEVESEEAVSEDTGTWVVSKVDEDDPKLLEEARSKMGLIGWKTREFLHFVNDNKELLPVEYQRVLHLIEQYLCK
jgi:hypothetical protein